MPEQCAALIDQLILLRHSRGWSQAQLAAASGLPQPAVARLESKRHAPTLSTLYKVASALGASIAIQSPDAQYLSSLPGMAESIREGMAEPLEDGTPMEALDWD